MKALITTPDTMETFITTKILPPNTTQDILDAISRIVSAFRKHHQGDISDFTVQKLQAKVKNIIQNSTDTENTQNRLKEIALSSTLEDRQLAAETISQMTMKSIEVHHILRDLYPSSPLQSDPRTSRCFPSLHAGTRAQGSKFTM